MISFKRNRVLVGVKLLAFASIVGVMAGCSNTATNKANVDVNQPGDGAGQSDVTLTLYNGQHKSVTQKLIDAFEKKTSITVERRDGSSSELAHQVVEEGDQSPADIIFTEESTPLIMMEEKGLLAKINDDAAAAIPQQYRDANNKWVGILARSRVVVYNPKLIKESDLPKSVLDLNQNKWKGQFGFVPTSGAFQAQISAMIKLDGKATAKSWLEGLKKNGKKYKHNFNVLDAVERGEIPFGLINNYYWGRAAKEKGKENMKSRLYYFGGHDLGDMVTVSGIAILKSSKHNEAAQKFIKFATSKEGQQVLADNSSQYPLNSEAKTHGMKPFSELDPPNGTLNLGKYSDGKAAINLLQQVGLL